MCVHHVSYVPFIQIKELAMQFSHFNNRRLASTYFPNLALPCDLELFTQNFVAEVPDVGSLNEQADYMD